MSRPTLADATQVPPSSLFGSLASGIVSFVEAASTMAQSRATTPRRGTTPARGITPGADRQRGTTPSAIMGHVPIITSAIKGMSVSKANESRPRLLGGMSVSVRVSKPHVTTSFTAWVLPLRELCYHVDATALQADRPRPNYPKVPKQSRPSTPTSTRVTRQNDGSLPSAPERLIDEAAAVAKKVKKRTAKTTTTTTTTKTKKRVAKTGAGVKKPTMAPATKATTKASGTLTVQSSSGAKTSRASKKTAKSPAKKGGVTKKAGVTKKSNKGQSVGKR